MEGPQLRLLSLVQPASIHQRDLMRLPIPRISAARSSPMLTILGSRNSRGFCDKLGRRDFLTIGGMALGGLALPDLLRAESQPGARSHKAIINVFLPGG